MSGQNTERSSGIDGTDLERQVADLRAEVERLHQMVETVEGHCQHHEAEVERLREVVRYIATGEVGHAAGFYARGVLDADAEVGGRSS